MRSVFELSGSTSIPSKLEGGKSNPKAREHPDSWERADDASCGIIDSREKQRRVHAGKYFRKLCCRKKREHWDTAYALSAWLPILRVGFINSIIFRTFAIKVAFFTEYCPYLWILLQQAWLWPSQIFGLKIDSVTLALSVLNAAPVFHAVFHLGLHFACFAKCQHLVGWKSGEGRGRGCLSCDLHWFSRSLKTCVMPLFFVCPLYIHIIFSFLIFFEKYLLGWIFYRLFMF